MDDPSPREVTQLLRAWGQGDERALGRLTPLVYNELHRIANRFMAHERPGHTLQTTALVNEVYVRLVDSARASWQDRAHFFAVCAKMMRRILVDWARSRRAAKRGGEAGPVELDRAPELAMEPGTDLVALDDALNALALLDKRKSQTVELRFFGGLSVEETADVLKVSPETVMRDWKLAKSWLRRELSRGAGRETGHGAGKGKANGA
jgi:RNA polymerase sigma-70 factor, ECF subfamily